MDPARTIRRAAAALACVAASAAPSLAAPIASSTFSTGSDGWTVVNDALGPLWLPIGGNAGGHIGALDYGIGQVWYFSAPAKFLGNVGVGVRAVAHLRPDAVDDIAAVRHQ